MDVDRILNQLITAGEATDRLEAVRALSKPAESSEAIVRALLDARDSDPDATVREEAARILRSPVHQAVIHRSIVLSMRNGIAAETSGALAFEAWEESGAGGTDPVRWVGGLSGGEAIFRSETTGEQIDIPLTGAAAGIQFEMEPASGEETGLPAPRRRIRLTNHTLNLSPTAYLKLSEWVEKAAAPPAAGRGRRAVPRIAWILLAAGFIQLALQATLSPFWGVVCILLGAANVVAPPRRLDLVNAIGVMLAGVWYILFAGPGLNLLGYIPGVWGSLRVFEFIRSR
jgi:hypothetical protein